MGKSKCSVEDCDSDARARGFCLPHYHRNRRWGEPTGGTQPESREVPPDEPGLVTHTRNGTVIKHGGSGTAYRNYGCRCRACTESNRVRVAKDLARRKGLPLPPGVSHGTRNAYGNWHCRCDPCREANRDSTRTYYQDVLSAESRYQAQLQAYNEGLQLGEPPTRRRDRRDAQAEVLFFIQHNGRVPSNKAKDPTERRLGFKFHDARYKRREAWAQQIELRPYRKSHLTSEADPQ